MSPQSSRDQLKSLLLKNSVRHGSFNLVSGLKSDVYIDGKLTTCSAAGTRLVGRVFLEKMRERGWNPAAVGGLSVGADPIVISIARESLDGSNPVDAFIVRKEPKKHGLQKFIEGIEHAEGLPVVIVDDVCTTGGSTATAVRQALAAGMRVIGALCLVDREMGASEHLREDFGIEFEGIFKLSELDAASADRRPVQPVTASAA